MTINIKHEPTEHAVVVLSDYLRINFTYQYVQELDGQLSPVQAKRVLYWAGKNYEDNIGINAVTLRKIARGVKSGLL